jgi:hypothetical protein
LGDNKIGIYLARRGNVTGFGMARLCWRRSRSCIRSPACGSRLRPISLAKLWILVAAWAATFIGLVISYWRSVQDFKRLQRASVNR